MDSFLSWPKVVYFFFFLVITHNDAAVIGMSRVSCQLAGSCSIALLQECSELGIEGKDIPRELTQLLQQLPGLYQEALSDINDPDITSAMHHYAAVTAYAHSPAPDSAADPSAPQQQTPANPGGPQQQTPMDSSHLLPHLHSIRSSSDLQQLGNGTSQAANSMEDKAAAETGGNQEIQWDITEEAGNQLSASSHGPADVAAGGEGGGNIDWDVAIEPAADTAGIVGRDPPLPCPPLPYPSCSPALPLPFQAVLGCFTTCQCVLNSLSLIQQH